jgi:hypothetical protein
MADTPSDSDKSAIGHVVARAPERLAGRREFSSTIRQIRQAIAEEDGVTHEFRMHAWAGIGIRPCWRAAGNRKYEQAGKRKAAKLKRHAIRIVSTKQSPEQEFHGACDDGRRNTSPGGW